MVERDIGKRELGHRVTRAQRLLLDLARRLEHEYPSAAESAREGLDETLRRSNAAERSSAVHGNRRSRR